MSSNTCDKCHKSFSSKFNLRRHAVSHEDPTHECPVFAKMFHRPSQLKKHVSCHTNVGNVLCTHCGLSFSRQSNLDRHVKDVHEQLKLFQCARCPKKYARKESLTAHETAHEQDAEEKPFQYDVCRRKYRSRRTLRTHVCRPQLSSFQCDVCEKGFQNKPMLNQHSLKHKPYCLLATCAENLSPGV